MGRLAGFRYREIIKRLKTLDLLLIDKLLEAMKYGTMNSLIGIQQYPTILETCQKEH